MTKNDKIELAAGVCALAALLFCLRSFLAGATSFEHDNTYWEFPLFQFYAESLLNGHFPLWNPYEHGGEAFYPLLGAPRFLDPTDPLTVLVGGLFTRDTLILHHWSRVIKTLVTLFTAYFCIRPWIKTLSGRLLLLPLLLFSYYMVGSFREQSYLAQFMSVPFIYFFLQRIVFFKDDRWLNWIGLGAFLGLNWQTYHFTAASIFLFFFFIGLACFHREALKRIVNRRLALSLAICFGMLGPNIHLFFTQDRYVYPVRMIPSTYSPGKPAIRSPMNEEGGPVNVVSALKLPYDMAKFSGTVANFYVYIESLMPDLVFFLPSGPDGKWRIHHDSHSYVSIVVWALCLMGLLFDPSIWFRRLWGFCLFGMGLFMLGPGGGIHRLLYHLFPPVSMFRHTIMLMPVMLFPMLFLAARGIGLGKIEWKFDRLTAVLVANGTLLMAILVKTVPQDHAWMLLLPAGALFWYGHTRWHAVQTFWALFLPPVLLAGVLAPNHLAFLIWLGASLLCLGLWQARKIGAWAVVVFVALDFFLHLQMSRPLYGTRPSPVKMLGVQTEAQPPVFPSTRGWYAYDFPHDPQAIRYMATLYRKPAVFSTPYGQPHIVNSFEKTMQSRRWSSYLLPKTYFDLIHSEYPLDRMEWAFAAGTDLLQFHTSGENKFQYQVEEYYPGRLRVKVTTDKAGDLFYSDGYAPEWRATVDGTSVPITLAKGHFKSVALEAGEHVVEFRFLPWLFLFAVGSFYLVFFGSLVSMSWLAVRSREPKRFEVPSLLPEPSPA